jgi:hypothetical protein
MAVIALCGLLLMFLACAQFSSRAGRAQPGRITALHNLDLYKAIAGKNSLTMRIDKQPGRV